MIRVLEKQIADKIAAGEVIERPVSIIKELVENSIDAGATSVIVEIKKGGKSYIRVTDNGSGIQSEDVDKAFLRHATSKIQVAKDLDSIETLGFRGEALASICAVTRTELLTKTEDDKAGTRVVLHGGEVISKQPTGCPDGTTIIVTDLFYNTPARLKFMKNDAAESSMIIDLVSQIALAYNDIAFRLINNGNVLFSTTGDGNRRNIIGRIFPSIDINNLVPIEHQMEDMSITGYISTPTISRPGKNGQIFFVNGRVVNSKVIDKGITEGYRERLFEGRHPIAFLFLNLEASKLDVNIHPNKKEVRFNEERVVEEFIADGIISSLSMKEAVVRVSNIFKETTVLEDDFLVREEQVDVKNIMSTNQPFTKNSEPEPIVFNTQQIELPKTNVQEDFSITIDEPIFKPFDFDEMAILGTIFNTYIMATDDDSFYLIDQHAAHERIFYEKLVGEYENDEKLHQPILLPIILDVDIAMKEGDSHWLTILSEMGFTIEAFGQNSYRISEIPTFMDLIEAEDFVKDFTYNIDKNTDLKNSVIINKLIMKSCKSAVKANDHLNDEEVKSLIKDLKQCINPFSCPHGRPTFIKLSKYEIERLFKRA